MDTLFGEITNYLRKGLQSGPPPQLALTPHLDIMNGRLPARLDCRQIMDKLWWHVARKTYVSRLWTNYDKLIRCGPALILKHSDNPPNNPYRFGSKGPPQNVTYIFEGKTFENETYILWKTHTISTLKNVSYI